MLKTRNDARIKEGTKRGINPNLKQDAHWMFVFTSETCSTSIRHSCNMKKRQWTLSSYHVTSLLLLLPLWFNAQSNAYEESKDRSNHAVILSTSRFWFNYRHVINALSIYDLIRRNGIRDENIILMLADDIPINARNPRKNYMHYYDYHPQRPSLIHSETQIDYRGDDVTVDNLRRVMLGRGLPNGKRVLHTNNSSRVLLYWTGHGGDSFFKFQDVEEITSMDIRLILREMKFHSLLFLADTCQAFTLGNQLQDIPNVYFIGSSLVHENSYAHHTNRDLGLAVIERYTFALMEFLQRRKDSLDGLTLSQALVDHLDFRHQRAHVGVLQTLGTRPLQEVELQEFLAAPTTNETLPQISLLSRIPSVSKDWADVMKQMATHTVMSDK
jgi:GPI-anchor transamidase subunit K